MDRMDRIVQFKKHDSYSISVSMESNVSNQEYRTVVNQSFLFFTFVSNGKIPGT